MTRILLYLKAIKCFFCVACLLLTSAIVAANPPTSTTLTTSVVALDVTINEIAASDGFVEFYFHKTTDITDWTFEWNGNGNVSGAKTICSGVIASYPVKTPCGSYSKGTFLTLSNITFHNTIEEFVLLDSSGHAVHYFKYTPSTGAGGTAVWEADADISTHYETSGPVDNIVAIPDGSTTVGDWKEDDPSPASSNAPDDPAGIDHYTITHSSPGVTCEGAQITVTAHDSSHADVTVSSDTALTVSTSPSVDSIVNSPTTISSGSSSTTFYLQQSAALSDIDIDVTDGTYTDSDDGGTEDYVFNFLDTAFRFYVGGVHTDTTPIGVQVAGDISSTQNFSLKAIRTNTDTGECEAALQGVTTSVDMAYECNNPTSCTGSNLLDITGASSAKSVTRNNNGATVSYTGVSLAFDANGVAPFTFKYDDAGQVTLHAKKVVSANSPNPAFTLTGSSNAFWTRPDKLVVSAKSGATNLNGDTAGTTNLDGITATQTHRAGENFDLTVSAYNSLGVVTPNYSPGQIQFKLERTGPTTHGVEGTLTYGSGGNIASELGSKPPSFKNVTLDSTVTPGVFGSVAAQYSEVGLLNLDVQDSNYGNASIIIPAAAINIGRFIPDHFKQTVAEDGYFEATCSTGTTFAYSGQKDEATDNIGAISYLTNPVLAITAYNKQNQITQNYYQDSQGSVNDYMKLSNANVSVTLPIVDQVAIGVDSNKLSLTAYMDMGTLSQNDLTTVVPADNPLAKGVLHYQLSDNDHFVYNRSANALVAPFTSDIDFSTAAITDTDGVNVITTVDASPTGVEIRFGRLLLENSFGPETSNFPQPMQIEHFDGASFVVSPNNDCVSYDASKISLTNISLDPALTSVLGGTGNFVAGKTRAIELKALEAGNQGQMGVSYGTHNWLKYDWDNDGDDDDPSATATFGLYRGNDRIIYWREVYN